MKKSLLMIAGVAMAALVAAGPAMAQKKTLAVVVKGLDNPFFTVLGDGCAQVEQGEPEVRVHLPVHRPGIERRRGRRSASSSKT